MTHVPIHDYQIHSVFSDGRARIDEMVAGAVARGAKVVCITDHAMGWQTKDAMLSFFETKELFRAYLDEISALKNEYRTKGVQIKAGLEVEVSLDGSLRLATGILEVVSDPIRLHEHVDIVVGVIHSESLEEDLIHSHNKAVAHAHLLNVINLLSNPVVDIWGHPFQASHGLLRRHFNIEERQAIYRHLRSGIEMNRPVAVEYNLNPMPEYEQWSERDNPYRNGRLEVVDESFYLELPAEVPLVVSSDAHSIDELDRYSEIADINPHIRQRLAGAL